MELSIKSLETLIDLVEIKLSCFEIYDRDDRKAQNELRHCLDELTSIAGAATAGAEGNALR